MRTLFLIVSALFALVAISVMVSDPEPVRSWGEAIGYYGGLWFIPASTFLLALTFKRKP